MRTSDYIDKSVVGRPRWVNSPFFQPKLEVNALGDRYEQEADQVADCIMRSTIQRKCQQCEEEERHVQRRPAQSSAPGINEDFEHYVSTLEGRGKPLSSEERNFFEPRFKTDFSAVRIHTDDAAVRSADQIHAHAYTLGNDIVFNNGQYQPQSAEGRRLMAHELMHVVQQRGNGTMPIQRDVKAYYKEKSDAVFTGGFMDGGSSSVAGYSAQAQELHDALAGLIADGKISEVKSTSGDAAWFAANHHKNAQLAEITQALTDAGLTNAEKLAKAIYDIHAEYLYSQQTLTTYSAFYSHTTKSKSDLNRNNSRDLTEYEIRQAKRVFKNAINYSKVTIEERSKIGSVGGYARTIGNTIYFPDEVRSTRWLIHELTHVWQYQTTGWTYAPKAIWAQVDEGYDYADAGKTNDQSLIDARAAGKTLSSYNKEQQGDIVADYFSRLQSGGDVSAYQPFIDDIK